MAAETNAPYVTNLVNSIIGVSVLAMPYCMKKCGLLLGLGLLIGMSWLTYISCNMLITAAVAKRRRTYEYLAFYTVGPTGKLAVELSMIGLMLGTCVAFYVIIGDLATAILEGFVEAESVQLRTFVIVFCALCVALPLGLMKNLSILGFIGFFSVIFYCIFVCVMIANSISIGFLNFRWMEKIELFRPAGIFQCLPIFSLAYACQCQLFVVYDSLEDASILRMETIVAHSLKIVTTVYCLVAILGYTTYIDFVEGNVLKNFSPNLVLDLIKFGFAMSVVVGFPLMIFPCRQSIHTLFFSKHPADGVSAKTFIEPFTFKAITLCIVMSTMMVAIFIPNVETILGLTGATMGSFICFIFPGVIFSKASPKGNTSISKFVLGVGCILLILCTYSNVYSATENASAVAKQPIPDDIKHIPEDIKHIPVDKPQEPAIKPEEDAKKPAKPPVAKVVDNEHRHEPANPVEPVEMESNENGGEIKNKNNNLVDSPDKQKFPGHAMQNDHIEIKKDQHQNHILKDKGSSKNELNADLHSKDSADHKKAEGKVEKDKTDQLRNAINSNLDKPANLDIANVDSKSKSSKRESEEKESIDHNEHVNDVKGDGESKVTPVDPNAIVDEEKLLHIIKEHHKEQHKLLDAQEVLIQALEKQRDVHKAVKDGDIPLKADAPDKQEERADHHQADQQQMIQAVNPQQQVNEQPQVGQQQPVNQPVAQQPQVNQPVAQQPQVNQPVAQQPQVNQPIAQQPQVNQPVAQQPQVKQPIAQQPQIKQPVAQQPQVNQPVAQQPQVNQPVGQQPQVNQPVAQQPQVNQPVGQQPQVNQPVVEQPQVNQPVGQQPPGNQPEAQQPHVNQPVAKQPPGKQPEAQQPPGNQPQAQQPQVKQPVAQQPQVNQAVVQQSHDLVNAQGSKNIEQVVNPAVKSEKKLTRLNREVLDNENSQNHKNVAIMNEQVGNVDENYQPNFGNPLSVEPNDRKEKGHKEETQDIVEKQSNDDVKRINNSKLDKASVNDLGETKPKPRDLKSISLEKS